MIDICVYEPSYRQDVIDMILEIQQREFNIPITISQQPDLLDIGDFYQKDGNFWVAVSENRAVGTIAVKSLGDGNAMLRKMFVKKEFRGREPAVSKRLLQKSLDWAAEKHFGKIYLGTTPQFLAAHRFYEKNGFHEIGREDLPEDFPVMAVDKKFYRYDLQ